jgi:CRP/FNR family transcriptional regulator, cyclic AMP receptor protein
MRKVLYIMGELNDEDVAWMVRAGRRLTLAKGQIIIHEGVEVADLFIVLDGAVEAEVAGIGSVARLAAGEIIGEMSFVDKAPPSATVRAGETTTVFALDKRTMASRLATNTGFAARFYRALAIYLADRLRSTTQRIKTVGRLTPNEIQTDELDETVLDQINMAGLRFEEMLKILMTARE